MACTYTFTLTRQSSQDKTQGTLAGHWLLVSCTAATAPDEVTPDTRVFVYQREVPAPDSESVSSFFSNVCCPNDLEEIIAVAEPDDDDRTVKLWRSDSFEAYFRTRQELEDCWRVIQSDVLALKLALQARCSQLTEPTAITI